MRAMDGVQLTFAATIAIAAVGVARQGSRAVVEEGSEGLAWLLLPRGRTSQIGEEQGKTSRDGIARWRSPHGSVRYVLFVAGEPVAAFQIVTRPGEARGANVFTHPDHRRRGYGLRLVAAARRDYPHLVPSTDLSPAGRAFVAADQRRRG